MIRADARPFGRLRFWSGLLLATCALIAAPAAMAACPVTDFTDRSLSSLSEIQRLSFVSQMTRTEFEALQKAAPGSPNYYSVIAKSASVGEARRSAQAKIDALHIDNSSDYERFWAVDFLTDEQLQKWVSCSSRRRPGIIFAGRPAGPGVFSLTFAHLAPIGVEKIRLRLVASRNISNIGQFEDLLKGLGEKDNFAVQTFPLRLSSPNEPAVLVIRAGWESPNLIYIPAYPAPEVP